MLLVVGGCASKPATPQWQTRTASAMALSEAAYLDGQERIAQQSLQQAREEVSRTASVVELARLELRQCALQIASLDWQPCSAYLTLPQDGVTPQLQAYHRYLGGAMLDTAERALLPPAQRQVATIVETSDAALQALRAIDEPLSRLLGVAVLMRRSGAPDPALIALAVETASHEGWRRPLLAWLLLQQRQATIAGDSALANEAASRIHILQSGGCCMPAPSLALPTDTSHVH
ncbi:hypothetical protein AAV94_02540 [Lampropedia cohaerens]|uniref:Uncharacterized protein n=2 Tax=Lampropedia cohaerens TaxID=1610491 RepID=A0A0U1Q2D3_9BURK|nr:hypothetical protein AAV94_02540 [Lampropedia cohaerens]